MLHFRIVGLAVALLLTKPPLAAEGGIRTITVRGESTVEVEPDYVEMEFSIFKTNNSAEQAKVSVDERVISVLSAE